MKLSDGVFAINKKEFLRIMLYVFIFGIVAHGFCFFNANFSHDSLDQLDYNFDRQLIAVSVGRFARPLYCLFRGNIASPLLIGTLSLLFFSIGIYYLFEILSIKEKVYQIIGCGILITCGSLTSLFATYMHDADSYALAFLLVTLGMTCSVKNKNILAVALYTLSIGIYQAYIQVAVVGFLILSFSRIVGSDDWKIEARGLFKHLILIAISMVMYFVIHKLVVLAISGLFRASEAGAYNSVSKVGKISLGSIVSNVINALKVEVIWFVFPKSERWLLAFLINLFILVVSFISIIKICKKRQLKRSSVMFIVFLFLALPFGMNIIGIVSGVNHDLTIFSFYFCYIFCMSIFSVRKKVEGEEFQPKEHRLYIAIAVALSIFIFNSIILSNKAYVRKDLETKATLSVMTRIMDRIEQTEGYVPGETKIAFVGDMDTSPLTKARDSFQIRLTGFDYNYNVTNNFQTMGSKLDTYGRYLNTYLGYNAIVDYYTRWDLDPDVKQMPCFPDKDSCRIFGDTMIVKLSNTSYENAVVPTYTERVNTLFNNTVIARIIKNLKINER